MLNRIISASLVFIMLFMVLAKATPSSFAAGLEQGEIVEQLEEQLNYRIKTIVGENTEDTLKKKLDFLNRYYIYDWEIDDKYIVERDIINNANIENIEEVLETFNIRVHEITENVKKSSSTFQAKMVNLSGNLGISLTGILKTVANVSLSIFVWIFKAVIFILPGLMVQTIGGRLAQIGVRDTYVLLKLEQILFNDVAITDVNVFNHTTIAGQTPTGGANNPIIKMRTNIATWYYAIRNLAIVIQLCVLIYIGIRMAMSSIAEQQAKYKQMFVNWLVRFSFNIYTTLCNDNDYSV